MYLLKVKRDPKRSKKIISLIDNLVYSEALISGKLYAVGVAAAIWAMLNLSKK